MFLFTYRFTIVVYFIVDVENYTSGIANFVQLIEKSVINFLKRYGLETQLKCGHPGIWWGEKKLASIGLRVSQGITQHGLALNIKNDLNVYAIKNGKAKSIISKETGLIAENELDHVSEEINYEFNALKNLYFESSN